MFYRRFTSGYTFCLPQLARFRCIVWKELGAVGLLPLLDPPPPPPAPSSPSSSPSPSPSTFDAVDARVPVGAGAVPATEGAFDRGVAAGRGWSDGSRADGDAFLYPADVEGDIIEAYAAALEHPRFGPCGEQQLQRRQLRQQRRGGASVSRPVGAVVAADSLEGCGGGSGGSGGGGVGGAVGGFVDAGEANGVAVEDDRSPDGDGENCERSMREVAVHHLACYLFPPALHLTSTADTSSPPSQQQPQQQPKLDGTDGSSSGGGRGGVNDNEIAVERGADVDENAYAWRPDFARRKMFDRLLLLLLRRHGGAGGGGGEVDGVGGSVAVSIFGYACSGSVSSDSATVAAAAAAAATAATPRRHRGSAETCGEKPEGLERNEEDSKGQEQQEQAEEGGRTDVSEAVAAPSRAPPPSHPGCEQGRRYAWRSSLGLRRRRALQAYCRESDALARAAAGGRGSNGKGGDIDGAEGIVRWLEAEREVEDVVARLLSVAATALPGGQK